jgi:hypothetical protein
MSQSVRDALLASPLTRFSSSVTDPNQIRADISDIGRGIDSNLIALLQEVILQHNIPFEFTVIKYGHHNDGPHGHHGGKAADGWPLQSTKEGDWAPAEGEVMDKFLKVAGASKYMRQFGLGGTMFTPHNVTMATQRKGVYVFHDWQPGQPDEDHGHLGAIFDGS